MVSVAARSILHCDRQTVYNYAAKYPELKTVIEDERELFLDATELKLQEAVQKGEAWAVCFALKTQGKSRGYIERQEHAGPGGGPIPVRYDLSLLALEELTALRAMLMKMVPLSFTGGEAARVN